ncbi:MAG TPA: pirin family protein [Candidatus Binatia bacterium]|nr:pirin family protein [Candidatus Binatia bacterium]
MKTTTTLDRETKGKIVKRPAEERGRSELGWLHSRFTFSFGEYYDPEHMGFRALRVINDDVVEPGQGFGMHPHRDAEIFTYVIDGELEHRDSMGNGAVVRAGDLQYMSAGSGVRHSEFNPSKTQPVHLLQIWLMPNKSGGAPRYAEKSLGKNAKPNALTLLFAGTADDGAVEIRQDAKIYFGKVDAGRALSVKMAPGRHAWLHAIKGRVKVLDEVLKEGDGAAVSDATSLDIVGEESAEFLFFDLT